MTSRIASLMLVGVVAMNLVACGNDKPAEDPKPTKTQTARSAPAPEPTKPAEPAPEPVDTTPAQAEAAPAVPDKPLAADAGQKRYETTCKICHDSGMLDAPKIGDKAAWQARIAKGKDTLYAHSAKGFNKMPAQATADVSEAEVHAAVDYIISKSN